jgi:phosphate transport system permease protein
MGVEHEQTPSTFGKVSRLRGVLFEYLSLAASVFGIFMLAILLVYVVVDAFSLGTASPEWLLTYFVTLVVPFIAFCLYSAGDRALTQQAVLALAGGIPVVAVGFFVIETVLRDIPRLSWQLVYLFAVVVPVTAYVTFAAGQKPVGRVGFGFLGRLVGGTAMGFMLVILFVVFEPRTWFWAYTLGLIPAAAVVAYSRRRPKSLVSMTTVPVVLLGAILGSRAGDPFVELRIPTGPIPVGPDAYLVTFSVVTLYLAVLTLPAAIALTHRLEARESEWSATIVGAAVYLVAFAASFGIGAVGIAPEPILEFYAGYPSRWGIYVWSLAVPLALAVTGVTMLDASRRTAVLTGASVFVIAVGGSLVSTVAGFSPEHPLLFLLTVSVPIAMFLSRLRQRPTGAVGLSLPLLLAAGTLLGAAVVETLGVKTPDIWLDWSFLVTGPSSLPEQAGYYPAIVGSVILISLVALFSFVFGVGTAVFLEEYAPDSGVLGGIARIVQINIANLAAVPSVVYGLLGLGLFVNAIGLGLGTALTGALTLTLLILPITIIAAQEAIAAVPDSMRNASYAMGATRWQTIKNVVLPEALPGVLTGTILSLGRAIGETAPLIMIGFPNTIFNPVGGIAETTTAMPMQIYVWSSSVKAEFRYGVLAAGVVTLLAVLLLMNATAIIIRNRSETEG